MDESKPSVRLGSVIKQHRKAQHLNQAELAAAIDMPGGQSYVSAVEQGKQAISMRTLERLAGVFQVSASALIAEAEGDGMGPDIRIPPVELFRAAGYGEDTIARLVETWAAQPASFRLKAVAGAQQDVQARQEHEEWLRTLLRDTARVL